MNSDLLSQAMSAGTQLHRQPAADAPIDSVDNPAAHPPTHQLAANNPVATGENLFGVLDAMEDTINAAVVQQQERNAAAIAPKVTLAEVKSAFGNEMSDFDHAAKVKGRSITTALAMIVFPIGFTMFVIATTLAMLVLPFAWLAGSVPNVLGGLGLLLYPLFWIVLLAAWVPVFHLVIATFHLLVPSSAEDPNDALHQRRTLTREGQPVLYEFVAQICEKVGAPAPARIDLDADFNASASFRRGWLSFGKDDLVLTLGVPLIACQSSEQLASVIAHEFGHFRQGSAMRSTYLIRSLTQWFMQSAYYGQLQADINEYYEDSEDANNEFIAFGAMVGFLGRQMMWYFGLAGHALSGSLSREMEYDADRHSVHLAGTKNFVDSMANVERFAVAHAVTIENLRMLYLTSGIMVNNISRMMLHIGKTMPAEAVMRIIKEKREQKEKLRDSHPPTRDRAAAAQKINQPGILSMNRPASDLVHHWQALCEGSTLEFYSAVLNQPVTKDDVVELEEILRDDHKLLLDKK